MITDKSRYGHDAVLDLNCGDSVQVLRTEPMTLTEQEQKIVQKYLGITLLEKSYIDANGHLMVVLSDGRTLDVGSARGLPGATPYLGENGNWFVEGMDTLQSARGLPGFTPYIGENEHWWIDETDTGIPARGIPLTEKADNTRFLRNDGTWQKVTPENIGAAKQSVVADHESRIEALEQRTVTAPYYTDDSVAYIKEVPENALPFASVDKVGGMTRKCTNLLRSTTESKTVNGVTFTVNDGIITVNGTATSDATFAIGYYMLIANEKYTFSGCPAGGSGNTYYVRLVGFGNDIGSGLQVNTPYDFNTGAEITIKSGYTANNLMIKPMLNFGDTALPYEPYFDGLRSAPVTEVKSMSANLVYQTKDVMECNGVTFTKNADGSITMNGTSTAQAYNSISGAVALANGTYTLGVDGSSRDAFAYIAFDDGTGATVSIGNRLTFTVTDLKKISYLILNTNAGRTFSNDTYYIMVNRGSTALPYTPYREPVTLPIPAEVQVLDGYGWGVNDDVYNYIDWEKKQFVKRVEKVVFKGTNDELWSLGAYGDFIHVSSKILFATNSDKVHLLCDRYKSTSMNGRLTDAPVTYLGQYDPNQNLGGIFFRNVGYTSVSEWRAYLSAQYEAGTPVTVFYELAEPVITDISDLLTDDNLIRVESGGTVTMVNEYGYDVPSEITYARLTWQ